MTGASSTDSSTPPRPPWLRLPFYHGWVIVAVAAVAMSATLPGRTHGLGLITEPLISDLDLERTTFARINVVTSLLGAAFCLPVGYLLDRVGTRIILLGVTALLGASAIGMALVSQPQATTEAPDVELSSTMAAVPLPQESS